MGPLLQGDHSDWDYKLYLKEFECLHTDPTERKRWQDVKRKYGITQEEWEEMWISQGEVCFTCRTAPKKICVDHCHKTGKIRGLLCHKCNFALGSIQDNPDTLQRMIEYLLGE